MIRLELATRKDIVQIIELGKKFHYESGYKKLNFSIDKLAKILDEVIEAPEFLLLTARKGKKIVGVFWGQLQEMFFSDDISAYDICFYLEEEYRGWTAIKMLSYYKRWAILMGAKRINLGISAEIKEDRIAQLYDKMGFKNIGTQHLLEV